MGSWRKCTKKQYSVYIKKWIYFCGDRVNPFQSPVNNILEVLVALYNKGLKYSVFQTALAAVNNLTNIFGNVDFSNHPLKRFMVGVFASRSSLLKYFSGWDAFIVLICIDGMQKDYIASVIGEIVCVVFVTRSSALPEASFN